MILCSARRLPLADKIIVLSSEGRVSQQGTYEQLRSESGFVRGLSFEERRVAGDLKGNQKPHDASTTTRSAQGPTQEQIQDLSRRTGDFSIYRYYFRSIKKSSSIYFISSNVIYAFCYGYLRSSSAIRHSRLLTCGRGLATTFHHKRFKYRTVHNHLCITCILC